MSSNHLLMHTRKQAKKYLTVWTLLGTMMFLALPQFANPQETPVDETQIIAPDLENTNAADVSETGDSAASSAAPARVTAEYLTRQKNSLLSQAEVGPTHIKIEADESIMAFWQEDQSGTPVGAVLLLHDQSQNPIWPETVLNLHQHLPLHGWATLSIDLAALPAPAPPARVAAPSPTPAPATDAEAEAGEPAEAVDETQVVNQDAEAQAMQAPAAELKKDEVPVPFGAQVNQTLQTNQARIKAAIEYLQAQGQYNIAILGLGFGGFQALQFVSEKPLPVPTVANEKNTGGVQKKALIERAIRALIVVNTLNQHPHVNSTLTDFMDQAEIPLLDLTIGVDDDVRASGRLRKQVSKKKQYQMYRLQQLTPPDGMTYQNSETELTRTVRGFLQRYASGTQL